MSIKLNWLQNRAVLNDVYVKINLNHNVGDFSVGKTSLIRRFVENVFDESYLTTIGVRVSQKSVSLNDGKPDATLLIWDIAGNDGLTTVVHQYIQGSSGAIITGDLTREETIAGLNKYYALFQELCDRPVVFALNRSAFSTAVHWTMFQNLKMKLKKQPVAVCFFQVQKQEKQCKKCSGRLRR